jgi:hypothetical protein
VHDALRQQLDPALVRLLADLAEHPRAPGGAKNKKIDRQRREFFELAWTRCETLLHAAHTAFASRRARESQPAGAAQPIDPALLAQVFRERLNAAMSIPAIEALFPAPWSAAARRVLPSPSPQFTATAMWGPVFGWCVLELLAESMGAEDPPRVALDLFDRLRLREPFAQAFAALGFEGEEGWRAAARIKVLLLSRAGAGKALKAPGKAKAAATAQIFSAVVRAPATGKGIATRKSTTGEPAAGKQGVAGDDRGALSPELWLDPDVRWLCGVHKAEGHAYVVREPYEELLWWLLLPSLLRLAGEKTFNRKAVEEMSKTIDEALTTAEAAGYRVDALLGASAGPDAGPTVGPEVKSQSKEPKQAQTIL